MEPHFFMEPISGEIEDAVIGEEYISKILSAKKIVIWGTARAAELVLCVCQKYGIDPEYVVDSFPHKADELWNGIPLIGQDTLFSLPTDYLVIVACHKKYGILDKLIQLHIPCIQFRTEPLSYINYPGDIRPLMAQNLEHIISIFNCLSDQKSRDIYLHALNYRRNFSLEHLTALAELCDPCQYFGNDVVPLIKGDIVIDCGAYIGDTLDAFYKSPGFCCNSYFALEPTPEHFLSICRYVQEHNLKEYVRPFKVAAWNKCEDLVFLDGVGSGNAVTEKGSIRVHADTIDDIVSNCDGKVDFIKMDVEGSEVPALQGARAIICRDHPTLAICVYHRIPDLWEIPLLIHSLYNGYKLYMRHYSDGPNETVLYAIP